MALGEERTWKKSAKERGTHSASKCCPCMISSSDHSARSMLMIGMQHERVSMNPTKRVSIWCEFIHSRRSVISCQVTRFDPEVPAIPGSGWSVLAISGSGREAPAIFGSGWGPGAIRLQLRHGAI